VEASPAGDLGPQAMDISISPVAPPQQYSYARSLSFANMDSSFAEWTPVKDSGEIMVESPGWAPPTEGEGEEEEFCDDVIEEDSSGLRVAEVD